MKVRFEIDIDKVVTGTYLDTRDPWALDENNKLNPVLLKGSLGEAQIAFVTTYYGDGEDRYANWYNIPLPVGTKIIEDDADKEPLSNEKLFDHIEDCYDKLSSEIDRLSAKVEEVREAQIPSLSEATSVIIQRLEEARENPSGTGISEKTLLEALRIVSNNKE